MRARDMRNEREKGVGLTLSMFVRSSDFSTEPPFVIAEAKTRQNKLTNYEKMNQKYRTLEGSNGHREGRQSEVGQ